VDDIEIESPSQSQDSIGATEIIGESPQSIKQPHFQGDCLDKARVDSIEIDSPSLAQESSITSEPMPKRRRISLSPRISASSQPESESDHQPDTAGQEDEDTIPLMDITDRDEDESRLTDDGEVEDGADEDIHLHRGTTAQRNPTFRTAPRFQLPETSDAEQQDRFLPEALSPQRRGAKYVPGGLASAVRDWLFQVKGNGGQDDAQGYCARLLVDGIRSSPGMILIQGRIVQDGKLFSDGLTRYIILTGEGRLIGLARNTVNKGCLVGIAQPLWDVSLDGRSWTVACDWSVL